AFACLPLVGADLRNIFGKETHRPVLSQPASGSSFNENMLLSRLAYNDLHDAFPPGAVSHSGTAALLYSSRGAPASKRAAGCFFPALLPLRIRSRRRRTHHRA